MSKILSANSTQTLAITFMSVIDLL